MRLKKLRCPNCGGSLDIALDDKEYIFCPYCGEKFFVENGKKEYTFNQNINIKKDININKNIVHTQHNIDEAEVIRAKTESREKKYSWVGWVGLVLFWCLLMGICFYMMGAEDRAAQKAINSGKISAGSYEDYQGEHYEAVVEQLKALGFENISCVNLDDSGVMFWKAEKVETVSIAGDTTFSKSDYFFPDESVIVKHH